MENLTEPSKSFEFFKKSEKLQAGNKIAMVQSKVMAANNNSYLTTSVNYNEPRTLSPEDTKKYDEIKRILISLIGISLAYVERFGETQLNFKSYTDVVSRLPFVQPIAGKVGEFNETIEGKEIAQNLVRFSAEKTLQPGVQLDSFKQFIQKQAQELQKISKEENFQIMDISYSIEKRVDGALDFMPVIRLTKMNINRNSASWISSCNAKNTTMIFDFEVAEYLFMYKE